MNENLKAQSVLFSKLLTERLIDAVKEKGFKTTVVASEVGIGQASMSRYIKHSREMPISVFMAICTYTAIDPQAIWNAAYVQAMNPDSLSADEKGDLVMSKYARNTMDLAANTDRNKEAERGAYPDAGA